MLFGWTRLALAAALVLLTSHEVSLFTISAPNASVHTCLAIVGSMATVILDRLHKRS